MMHPLSIRLFDFSHTLAAPLLERVHYPWEVLPKIAEYIQELAQQLPDDFEEIAPQVWVGQGTYIEKTALIMGPAIIGRNCQIRHSAFIRDQVIMGDQVVVGNSSEVKNAILFVEVELT